MIFDEVNRISILFIRHIKHYKKNQFHLQRFSIFLYFSYLLLTLHSGSRCAMIIPRCPYIHVLTLHSGSRCAMIIPRCPYIHVLTLHSGSRCAMIIPRCPYIHVLTLQSGSRCAMIIPRCPYKQINPQLQFIHTLYHHILQTNQIDLRLKRQIRLETKEMETNIWVTSTQYLSF